ncbi:MAG: coproporphyrinogen dehydrogenase HemZ [Christensenellales bacterium]
MINIHKRVHVWCENEIYDVLHMFGKYFDEDLDLDINYRRNKYSLKFIVTVDGKEYFSSVKEDEDGKLVMKNIKRTVKYLLYQGLSDKFGVKMPWGSLTGVRPSKLVYDFISEGVEIGQIPELMMSEFDVSESKANLICEVVKNQLSVSMEQNEVDLYINIPICPTRCSYCSFISSEYERCKKYIDDYIKCLVKEIDAVKELIKSKNFKVKNIYMGGGTPTTLTSEQLDTILSSINFEFNEFTVECGRPDTITRDKLQVLKNHNVTRISINPQTLKDETLKIIGRNHTSGDFYRAFNLAKKFDFIINTDLIAGLPGEKFLDFKTTVDNILKLEPDNITVHTLAIKNASVLKQDNAVLDDKQITDMLDYAYCNLKSYDYKPYYLYRQKNMLGLYENVGYYRNNMCEFNVESMEEKANILAVGAGAISKRVFVENNRIERCANVKQIQDYILRIDEMIQRKIDLFNDDYCKKDLLKMMQNKFD